MIDFSDLRTYVVKPALLWLDKTKPGVSSEAAENLVLGTALIESGGRYLNQMNGGPARGLWQMEDATHDDHQIWLKDRQPALRERLMDLAAPYPSLTEQMRTNLMYGAAMCRLHYWRKPQALPEAGDADALGWYWKNHYNTALGAGKPEHFSQAFRLNRIAHI